MLVMTKWVFIKALKNPEESHTLAILFYCLCIVPGICLWKIHLILLQRATFIGFFWHILGQRQFGSFTSFGAKS